MNRILKYEERAVQCLKLAELSSETDRRALIEMAADWHALADKVRRQREANPQEHEPPPVAPSPISPEPSDQPFRPKRPQKKAQKPVWAVFLKSR
jgi:hypothetical protein